MKIDLDDIIGTGIALVVFLVSIVLFLTIIILAKAAFASEEFIWVQSNGNNQLVIIQQEQDEPIEVDIKEDDWLEHSLDRELLRQEERREEWWQEDYREFLRDKGVDEGLIRGW